MPEGTPEFDRASDEEVEAARDATSARTQVDRAGKRSAAARKRKKKRDEEGGGGYDDLQELP